MGIFAYGILINRLGYWKTRVHIKGSEARVSITLRNKLLPQNAVKSHELLKL